MHQSEQAAIRSTLAFYELFGVGRTIDQLAPYVLNARMNRKALTAALTQQVASKTLVQTRGAYAFSRPSAAQTPIAQNWARSKRKLVEPITRILASSPFVRMAALSQSVAMETAKASSDLDTFVIAEPNRLWTARFLAMARLKLAGIAKRHGTTADHGCFGFWIDTNVLDLTSIAIADDIYLAFWIAHLEPLANRDQTYEQFVSANQSFLRQFPNWQSRPAPTTIPINGVRLIERCLGGWFGNLLEKFLYRIQSKKIWRDDIAHRVGASVAASPTMCKLHHFDKRTELRDRWYQLTQKKKRRG